MTLLLLARTIASRWHGPRSVPATPPIRGDAREAPAPVRVGEARSGGLVSSTLTARLYRLGPGTDDVADMGRIGDPADGPQGAAVIDLSFVVEAAFDEPLFPYLIAITPDGTGHVQFPEQDSDSSTRRRFQCPSGDYYLPLKEDGLLALILLGSHQPLSTSEVLAIPEVDREGWKRARTSKPWLFDGERCEPLARDRDGGLGKVSHGLKPFADLCQSLSSRPGIAAVRAVAFPIKPAPKSP
jgi:hypothetical protein